MTRQLKYYQIMKIIFQLNTFVIITHLSDVIDCQHSKTY